MTDPNDDLSSAADPGSMNPHETTGTDGGDLSYDEVHRDEPEPGVPGRKPDSPAVPGSVVEPPD